MRSRPLHAIFLSAVSAASLVLVSGCAGAPEAEAAKKAEAGYPVKVVACGFTSELKARPESAVTMNQGATEIALALGVQDRLAGTAYLDDAVAPQWQAAYDEVKVISKEYPDRETLFAAKPDFVYGSYESAFEDKAAGTQQSLDELGIGSYLSPFGCEESGTPAAVEFETVWSEIKAVGTAFGVADRADAIEKEQQELLDHLGEHDAGAGLQVFWYDSGDKTAFAGAGQGGPQLILDAIGATNVFADLDGGWKDVTWEKVVATDPDVIVLADASWSTADEKIALLEKDPVLSQLRAVKTRAYVIVPFSETTPGVRLAEGAEHVAEQITELKLS